MTSRFEQVPSNQWNTPWRASGFAVYDTNGNLVAHTGITGNRSMHGKQLEMMAAMIAEAVNAYSAGEPRVGINGAGEILGCTCQMCEFHRSAEAIEQHRRATSTKPDEQS